ncbi:MAG: molybdate ABC transporter substrate-binding protein [Betaproteobacteria bacterium]|nr:molybdate ABC transporter substrate-binding protein [Betaproteobacteria bacterium]NBY72794.1 molybdate ABC transporter substrate-binding protein [Betaproteobacteria bacterium]NDD13569.1 molybdate ABC transporter substrate-binding protein [Betaproteobacteria bacterium]
MRKFLCAAVILIGVFFNVKAADVSIAVAANFTAPMQKIAQAFEHDTGYKAVLSFGSTGAFYAQIKNGAPYQVLLAADDETPLKLEKEGLGVGGSRFTYATGRLVLWSKKPDLVDAKGDILKLSQTDRFARLAIANPKLAPYGAAAVETMIQLGVLQALQPKWVQGDNIAQAYQFVATENAALGFVALSQVMVEGRLREGSAWVVPAHLHSPIQQDAVLLARGQGNPAAMALLQFMKTDKTKALIRAFGYELP